MSQNPYEPDPVRDLAASIYVQLVKEAVVISVSDAGSTASITANPEALARISFKLSEAFVHASNDIKNDEKPKFAEFDVAKLDFEAWTTK